MHQAQPKEGHKIWLTQETDAKSWSSLKHIELMVKRDAVKNDGKILKAGWCTIS